MYRFPLLRKDRDSNPGYAFDVYTLSRRASSATRASFLDKYLYSGCKVKQFLSYKRIFNSFFLNNHQNPFWGILINCSRSAVFK